MRLRIPSWPNLFRYLQHDLRFRLLLKKYTSFKNVWQTWGPALPTLLADLMIFCHLGPMYFKNSLKKFLFLVTAAILNGRWGCRTQYWKGTTPAKFALIWFSSFRGEDLNVIFYQNMSNLHNRYKSVERKISQKNPEYMLIYTLSCSSS